MTSTLHTSVALHDSYESAGVEASSWNDLLMTGPSDTVFLTWGWQTAWWSTLGRGRLRLLVATTGGRVSTIAPFFVDGGMAFLVGSGGSDYLDLIGDVSPETLRAIVGTLREAEPDLLGIRLYHVPGSSPTPRALDAAATGLELVEEGWLEAPQLDRAQDPGGLTRAAGKKSLVRHTRYFARNGELEIRHLADAAEIRPLLPAFFDQHVARWAGTGSPSLFEDARQRTFYDALVVSGAREGWLRFSTVLFDGEPIAFHLGAHHGGRFLWYKPSFSPDWAKRSPGEVLLRGLLLRAQEEGARVFDLGLGTEPFKDRFATGRRRVRTWGLYPRTGA